MPRFSVLRRGLVLALITAPVTGLAQGSLSSQGFGYPTGQLSAGALGAAGAGAESDPNSPINPAALTQNSRFNISVQFQPEFRSTSVGGQEISTSVMRFPTFQASGTYKRLTGSAGVSTLLDRTWVNQYSDSLLIGGEWIDSEIRTASAGALSDVRAALGYVISTKVQVGLGLHGFAGENRTEFSRVFPDSTGVGAISQASSFGFSGTAVSAGVIAIPREGFVIAASIRAGGSMRLEEGGLQVGEGRVPTRFGIGVNWLAVPGAAFSARIDRTRWSRMEGLGTTDVSIFDATEIAVGTDVLGPKIGGVNSVVRAGVRDRTLPFGYLSNQVRERAVTFGVGVPVARGRAQIDLAGMRASRSAAGIDERAWFVSIGIGIRP